jgi:hypothetical protein
MLKPQDILVALKLVALGNNPWSYESLSSSLGMSLSQLHSSVKRCKELGLLRLEGKRMVPNVKNMEELIVHGLKYVFELKRGALTRGIPTSYGAPPLDEILISSKEEPPPVWPDPEGSARGFSFSPIYKYAPEAAKKDRKLYEMLALIDAIRAEGAREKQIAIEELKSRFRETSWI